MRVLLFIVITLAVFAVIAFFISIYLSQGGGQMLARILPFFKGTALA